MQNVAGEAVVTLTHARYLVLKNLAGSLACDDATCEEALQLYIEASELDASDTVLWQRLGSLVSISKPLVLPVSAERQQHSWASPVHKLLT